MTLPNSWSLQTLILVSAAVAVASALMALGLWWVRLPKSLLRTNTIPWFWRHHLTLIGLLGEPLASRLWPAADAAFERLAKRLVFRAARLLDARRGSPSRMQTCWCLS